MRKIILSILLIFIALNISAQRQIKAKGDYTHPPTNFVFPTQIDNFKRVKIYSFDKKRENIGVVYEYKKTTITLYAYPAGDATEHRLTNQFLGSLQAIATAARKGIDTDNQAVRYEGDYICNGFKAEIKDNNKYNSLALYECGRWFFKIRMTSDDLDSLYLNNFEQKLLTQFEPSKLTALSPLQSQSSVHIAPYVVRSDSVFFVAAVGYTLEKVKWAWDSVPENERASGFPSIHLGMHVAALKAFINSPKEKCQDCTATDETLKMLNELQEIYDNGFLELFILDEMNMLLNFGNYEIKEDVWENYLKWKNNRKFLFHYLSGNILFSYLVYVE